MVGGNRIASLYDSVKDSFKYKEFVILSRALSFNSYKLMNDVAGTQLADIDPRLKPGLKPRINPIYC